MTPEGPSDESGESDESLMRAYASGDSAAFERLYASHSGRVYAYLSKKLENPQEVDEVFQACFLKFHRTRSNYNPAFPVLQWLFVIARTTLLDYIRKAGRQVDFAEGVDPDEIVDPLSQEGRSAALEESKELESLAELPQVHRQALEMRVVEELPYDEIAARLGKSEANVRQMVSRALKRLRASLTSDPKGGVSW